MKKIYLLIPLFIPIFFTSCEKEEMPPELAPATNRAVEKIRYVDLPSHISNYFSGTKSINNKKDKTSNRFGEVKINLPVVKITNKKKQVSYSFTLTTKNSATYKTNSQLYFDNLVIKELPGEEDLILVFRYEPEETWYSNSKRSLSTYSGKIMIFDLGGNIRGNMTMVEGVPVAKNHNKRIATVYCLYVYVNSVCWESKFVPKLAAAIMVVVLAVEAVVEILLSMVAMAAIRLPAVIEMDPGMMME